MKTIVIPQFLPGQGLICRQSRQLLLHAGDLVRRNADARQLPRRAGAVLHGILFYSQLGALKSTSNHAVVRRVMDLLLRRNLAVYRKTPTYAKTGRCRRTPSG